MAHKSSCCTTCTGAVVWAGDELFAWRGNIYTYMRYGRTTQVECAGTSRNSSAISVVTTLLQLRAWEAELHDLVNTPSSSWTASVEASGLGLITGLILVLAHLTSASIHPKLNP
jgi:hypothetical protein